MADEPTALTEDELVDEIRAWAEEYAREHDLVLNRTYGSETPSSGGLPGTSSVTADATAPAASGKACRKKTRRLPAPASTTWTRSPAKESATATSSSGRMQ